MGSQTPMFRRWRSIAPVTSLREHSGTGVFRSTDNGDTWTGSKQWPGFSIGEVSSRSIPRGDIFAGTFTEAAFIAPPTTGTTGRGDNGLTGLMSRRLAINSSGQHLCRDMGREGCTGVSVPPTTAIVGPTLTTDVPNAMYSFVRHQREWLHFRRRRSSGWSGGVFRSTDNGDSWASVQRLDTAGNVNGLLATPDGRALARHLWRRRIPFDG